MAAVKLCLFISLAFFLTSKSTSSSTSISRLLEYHSGSLLHGKISVNLIWYGKFKPSQKDIVTDFIISLSFPPFLTQQPSVSTWWRAIDRYYHLLNKSSSSPPSLYLGRQISDENYSLGKYLSHEHISLLSLRGAEKNAVSVILTASNVSVNGFCIDRCGAHGSGLNFQDISYYKFPFIWVGNSAVQCPKSFCAGPFLPTPNGDSGLDDMVVGLAGLLVGTATNPFGDGFYRGPYGAASVCKGIYSTGELLVDPTTGAGYNAHGVRGRKYLLPAIYDPTADSCATLV